MAYTSLSITAADNTLFEADNPIIIPKNILNDCLQGPFIQNSLTPAMSDSSHASYPVDNVYDGYNHKSGSYSSSATTHVITGQNNAGTFDTFFFHCEDPSNNISAVKVRLSDSSIWATYEDFNNDTSVDTTIRRYLARLDKSGTEKIVYNLNYFLVAITFGSSTSFYCNELFMGKRIQLNYAAYGYDSNTTIRENAKYESKTGIIVYREFSRGQREFSIKFMANNDLAYSRLRDIWNESNGGAETIVFCEKPYSEPEKAGLFKIMNKDFNLVTRGYLEHDVTLTLREQGGSPIGIE